MMPGAVAPEAQAELRAEGDRVHEVEGLSSCLQAWGLCFSSAAVWPTRGAGPHWTGLMARGSSAAVRHIKVPDRIGPDALDPFRARGPGFSPLTCKHRAIPGSSWAVWRLRAPDRSGPDALGPVREHQKGSPGVPVRGCGSRFSPQTCSHRTRARFVTAVRRFNAPGRV